MIRVRWYNHVAAFMFDLIGFRLLVLAIPAWDAEDGVGGA